MLPGRLPIAVTIPIAKRDRKARNVHFKNVFIKLLDANVQRFLLCLYCTTRQPEPLLGKINTVNVIFYFNFLLVRPGPQMIIERSHRYVFISAHSKKSPVICRFLIPSTAFLHVLFKFFSNWLPPP